MVEAGLYLDIYLNTPSYVLLNYNQLYFGKEGGVLCVDYDKKLDSSESGFTISLYNKFIINDKKVFEGNELEVVNTLWEMSEVDSDGNSVVWERNFIDTCKRHFPIPSNRVKSIPFIKVTWIGNSSTITSTLKLHLLNNN